MIRKILTTYATLGQSAYQGFERGVHVLILTQEGYTSILFPIGREYPAGGRAFEIRTGCTQMYRRFLRPTKATVYGQQ